MARPSVGEKERMDGKGCQVVKYTIRAISGDVQRSHFYIRCLLCSDLHAYERSVGVCQAAKRLCSKSECKAVYSWMQIGLIGLVHQCHQWQAVDLHEFTVLRLPIGLSRW